MVRLVSTGGRKGRKLIGRRTYTTAPHLDSTLSRVDTITGRSSASGRSLSPLESMAPNSPFCRMVFHPTDDRFWKEEPHLVRQEKEVGGHKRQSVGATEGQVR
jgi:hypothetical protein